jgi:hypothetical protein
MYLRVPGGQLAGEADEGERSRLELAGLRASLAGPLSGGPRARDAQASFDLGFAFAAGAGTVERCEQLMAANCRVSTG